MRGSIRKRGSNSWSIQVELDRVAGKRHRRFVTIRGTRKDAQKELTRLLASADAGTLPSEPTQMTVEQYLDARLDSATDLSPKTLERYRELAQHQIVPHIGQIKLQKLRPEHLEQWHAHLLESGLSARTVGHAHRVLSGALKRAVENGTLARNVALVRKPPPVEKTELEILKPEEISRVMTALVGHTLHPIVSLALATGMRRGELLALQWNDLDFDAATLRVERSLEETKAGLRIKPPKTRRGRRSITIPADAVSVLRAHRVRQMELRLALGQGGQPELVFSTIEGRHLKPNSLSRFWQQTCAAKGLPAVAFHALRHTHVSTLIRAGVDVLTISRRIGHSSPSMTLDVYGHLIQGADTAAAKAIQDMFK